MSAEAGFQDLLRRIRDGDESAAAELVRSYEPLIRREIRFRLKDPRLGRVLDSMDVCQSVLRSFFVSAAVGQYDLDSPRQLLQLLVTMAKNKVVSAARRERRKKRDSGRHQLGDSGVLNQLASGDPTVSRVLNGQELLARFRQALTAEERQLADLRAEGVEWADIAQLLGGTAPSRRMQFARAVRRIARQLGLEDDAHV